MPDTKKIELIVVRHGNAVPAAEGQDDLERRLSDTGIEQADARWKSLGELDFALVISSPALRAVQTASIVGGVPMADVVTIPELRTIPGPDGDRIEEMFDLLRYQPPQVYLDHDLNNGCLMRYSEAASAAVSSAIESLSAGSRVLAAGHAMLSPLAFVAMTADQDLRAALCGFNLAEAGAFRVTIENGIVTDVFLF